MLALALFRGPAAETRKRGKVLREPGAGPGLMIVEGQQFSFSLTDLWQSPQPPKIGMTVESRVQAGWEARRHPRHHCEIGWGIGFRAGELN